LVWPDADIGPHRSALERLCAEVIRIGHSSSFVRCWLTVAIPTGKILRPVLTGERRQGALRVPESGRLESLIAHRQKILDGKIGDELPPRARQIGYREDLEELEVPRGSFAEPLLVFRQLGESGLGLRQTSAVMQALRGTLIAAAEKISPEAKALVSGHAPDGSPLRDAPHLAYLPLGFVGHEHADGHLMGLAIAFPQELRPDEEDLAYKVLGKVLQGDRQQIRLVMGALGELRLEAEEHLTPPWTLRTETWCGPSRHWASATPIVLDRMQNRRRSDPDGWAADQVADMCKIQGLPIPEQVVIRQVSYLSGAPTCHEMPPLRRKDGSSHRTVHAHLTWMEPIAGPLLLGAGRFKGYGLCKPCGPWEVDHGDA
jgi:CRISPR-associated protein Csb2